ncbi:HAD family hydrolase, partial [Dokdonella sp.]|uniref:HAD family hydrolase n=1 Tax=Dokdonella sp. TaxID=2291710 RepID=UPI003C39FC8A
MDTHLENAASELAAEQGPRVVLFDFDGVLMRGDAFSRFVRARLRGSWWRLLIALAVMPLLLPLYAIRSLRMPILSLFVRISLLGISPSRFDQLTREFAREIVGLPRI